MISYTMSTAWSHPILSLCCTEYDRSHGAVLSGRITSIVMSRTGSVVQEWSVMHERALETREPTCVPRTAKPFLIPVVHSPPGAVRHVAASELLSQEGRALRRRTHGSTRSPLSGRQSPEPCDTW
jgi:hypothetical protein